MSDIVQLLFFVCRPHAFFISNRQLHSPRHHSPRCANNQTSRGSIEATLRVRHFQVDAMLPTARYPIIFQPIPLGVDRRDSVQISSEKDANNFWELNNESAQSTDSAFVAGVLSWLINVGSNFAHVSPSFRYKEVADVDRYCDAIDLATELAISYTVSTIKQVSVGIVALDPPQITPQNASHVRLSCSVTKLYSVTFL